LAEEDPRADLPPLRRPGNGNGAQDPDTAEAEAEAKNGLEGDANGDEKEDVVPLSELEQECAKARSILNANIGACHVKLGEHKEAVEACTAALEDDPFYTKVLQRRAASNEQLNSWASLSSAQEDYKALLKLFPSDSADYRKVQASLQTLGPRLEAAQKKETGEMLNKLKGIGNQLLGNFGLSTDNFKFEPNGQGGYSMNFVR